jgi:hypothetical protein
MDSVFVQLVPLILGAVLAPIWVIIVLLMLASPGGVAKGAAFVLGMTLTRLAQGVVFGLLLGASPDAHPEDGGASPVVSTLLLVVGILLLVTAVRKWRKEEDPDEPPPKWMQSMEQTTPLKALGLGALLVAIGVKLWVFTLSAIGVISAAELGLAGGVAAYLAYIVAAQSILILAVLFAAVAPRASEASLGRAMDWLTTYNRPITITVALIFGLYFVWDGATGLLS